jgi:hypothetical protein
MNRIWLSTPLYKNSLIVRLHFYYFNFPTLLLRPLLLPHLEFYVKLHSYTCYKYHQFPFDSISSSWHEARFHPWSDFLRPSKFVPMGCEWVFHCPNIGHYRLPVHYQVTRRVGSGSVPVFSRLVDILTFQKRYLVLTVVKVSMLAFWVVKTYMSTQH